MLVIGAGPSGLSAAYHLARRGHTVTVGEAGPMAGGMMRFGIPKYRLPREVLDAEVQRILDLGVTLELDAKVTDLNALRDDYDAVFLAVGAQIGKRAYIPAGSAAHMLDAVSMLRSLEEGEKPLSAGGSRCTAEATPPWTRRGRPNGSVRPRRSSSTGGTRTTCLPTSRSSSRPPRKASLQVAHDHQAGRPGQARHREDGARRVRVPAADR